MIIAYHIIADLESDKSDESWRTVHMDVEPKIVVSKKSPTVGPTFHGPLNLMMLGPGRWRCFLAAFLCVKWVLNPKIMGKPPK